MEYTGRKPTVHDIAIGRRIKVARRESRYTMKQLGRKSGKTFQQIQKYESGASRVAAGVLFEISVHLRKPVSWFFADCKIQEDMVPPVGDDPVLIECIQIIESLSGEPIMDSILHILKATKTAHAP